MVYNTKEYWTDKDRRSAAARYHTNEMISNFKNQIVASVRDTIMYSPGFSCSKEIKKSIPEIFVEDSDSVVCILRQKAYNNRRTAVLNFASYKNPGGQFLNGSKAQEECLCHESFLFNVLKEFPNYYEWNNLHKNRALYLNRALYTYNILFSRGDNENICDVITCAAPNKTAAQKYCNVSDEENLSVLKSRIKFVLDIAKDNNVDTLILGAYGCGVFGQDPREVAMIFKGFLNSGDYGFDKVIFAIPDDGSGNYKAFREVFG